MSGPLIKRVAALEQSFRPQPVPVFVWQAGAPRPAHLAARYCVLPAVMTTEQWLEQCRPTAQSDAQEAIDDKESAAG